MTPQRAYRAVRTALKQGFLSRPDICSRCGVKPARGSDGRSTVQAHHHRGYGEPLAVEWLCAACHRQDTPLPAIIGGKAVGEINGAARLTIEAVRDIRASDLSSRRLGQKYGVDKKTILLAKRGETWGHIE